LTIWTERSDITRHLSELPSKGQTWRALPVRYATPAPALGSGRARPLPQWPRLLPLPPALGRAQETGGERAGEQFLPTARRLAQSCAVPAEGWGSPALVLRARPAPNRPAAPRLGGQ